jgi:Mg2+-importing ATPase
LPNEERAVLFFKYYFTLNPHPQAFWSFTSTELQQLQTTPQGLRKEEAQERLARHGSNLLKPKKRTDAITLLLSQFYIPIILILLFAAALSLFLHDSKDALFIVLGTIIILNIIAAEIAKKIFYKKSKF